MIKPFMILQLYCPAALPNFSNNFEHEHSIYSVLVFCSTLVPFLFEKIKVFCNITSQTYIVFSNLSTNKNTTL